jgi:hypothetical protein
VLGNTYSNSFLSRVNCLIIKTAIDVKGEKMTSNIVKNFAAVTVAGTLLGFIVASTAVGVAVIINITGVHAASQSDVSSVQR